MKIKANVIEASDHGDKVHLVLQGREQGAADWRAWLKLAIDLPQHKNTCRTYYLGRAVIVEVKPG